MEQKKFFVTLERTIIQRKYIEVIADNEEDAYKQSLENLRYNDDGWLPCACVDLNVNKIQEK